jgi:hypothetical protein
MAAVVAARRSRPANALQGLVLTATLQSFPTFATAAAALRIFGNHDLVGDPGVALFVIVASFLHALLSAMLGPGLPSAFRFVYEPAFFDPRLSLSAKVAVWRGEPAASVQLVTIVLLLSVMAVATASMG